MYLHHTPTTIAATDACSLFWLKLKLNMLISLENSHGLALAIHLSLFARTESFRRWMPKNRSFPGPDWHRMSVHIQTLAHTYELTAGQLNNATLWARSATGPHQIASLSDTLSVSIVDEVQLLYFPLADIQKLYGAKDSAKALARVSVHAYVFILSIQYLRGFLWHGGNLWQDCS